MTIFEIFAISVLVCIVAVQRCERSGLDRIFIDLLVAPLATMAVLMLAMTPMALVYQENVKSAKKIIFEARREQFRLAEEVLSLSRASSQESAKAQVELRVLLEHESVSGIGSKVIQNVASREDLMGSASQREADIEKVVWSSRKAQQDRMIQYNQYRSSVAEMLERGTAVYWSQQLAYALQLTDAEKYRLHAWPTDISTLGAR